MEQHPGAKILQEFVEGIQWVRGEDTGTEGLLAYPASIIDDAGDGITITFQDFPEAITGANNRVDALKLAEDCLAEAIAGRIKHEGWIPAPSKANGRPMVVVRSSAS